LAERGELLCIAPATANFLAKAAAGAADDLLSTLYLSFSGPILVAPAMNCDMWDKPAVARNVATLRDDGAIIVGPETGWLSCRKTGAGRLAAPSVIFDAIAEHLPRRKG
jgi:phosphopantothenoylcysteine decarboxylase/phosphopantothenate--cysteine ligase